MRYAYKISLLAAIIALPFVAPVLAQSPAPATAPLLLSIATKVTTLDNVNDDTYAWISDHQVLFFRLTPLTKQQFRDLLALNSPIVSSLPKGTQTKRYMPMISDTESGKITPLEPFATKFPLAFLTFGGIVSDVGQPNSTWTVFPMEPYALSHDGKWLSWFSLSSSKPECVVSALDGSKDLRWPVFGSQPVCEPDNQHWVELQGSGSAPGYGLAVIHDLRTPSSSRKVKISLSQDDDIQGIASNGSLVLWDFNVEHPDRPIKIMVFDLSGDLAKMQSYTITPPTGLPAASEAALSPAGDKLAWIFDNNYETLDTNRVGTYLLCTSNLDGSNMQKIGSMLGYLAPKEVNHQLYYWPETLRWTLDGKRISFIFRDALYTVPAPQP